MIGVVILNYNSSSDTLKCIDFLSRQEDVALDIIVVDNASASSDDVDALRMACESKGARFHAAPHNRGYNAGNNIGIRMALDAGCDAVMIANPDMEFPDTAYVATIYRELMSRPGCAAISGAILSPDGRYQTPMKPDGSWTGSLAWIRDVLSLRSKRSSNTDSFIDAPATPHQCHKLSGCCLMLRGDYLREHGLFDENLFLYCEESVLSRRIEAAGCTMYYTSAVKAVHRHISGAKGDPRPRFRHWRDSRLYFIRRYSRWPWYGRMIASLSFRLYTFIMITLHSIRHQSR